MERLVQFVFIIFGCRPYSFQSLTSSFLALSVGTLVVGLLINGFFTVCLALLNTNITTNKMFEFADYLLLLVFIIVWNFYTAKKLFHITRNHVSSQILEDNSRRKRLFTFYTSFPFLVSMICCVHRQYFLFTFGSLKNTMVRPVTQICKILIFLKPWFFISIISFLSTVRSLSRQHFQLFSEMSQSFRTTAGGLEYQLMSPIKLSLLLKKIRREMILLEEAFSMIPLTWFYCLFEVTMRYSYFATFRVSFAIPIGGIFSMGLYYAYFLSFWVMMFILINEMSNQKLTKRQHLNKLSAKITNLKSGASCWTHVLHEIEATQKQKFRCSQMFELGKGVIVPFFSSLVPVTVMAVKLMSQRMDTVPAQRFNATFSSNMQINVNKTF